jgi:hypothetical protein
MTVKDEVKKLPSKHLGYVNYVEIPTNENYNASFININENEQSYINSIIYPEKELKNKANYFLNTPISMTLLPDFIRNYINYTIDVRIPRYYLYDNENVYNRQVWGTDVYTDDSDIVAILYHCGILKSNDPFANFETLKTGINIDTNSIIKTRTEPVYAVQPDNTRENISDVLVVRLRVLPSLEKYIGCYRHCYNSRSWQGSVMHDGVSVSVETVRWDRKANVQCI